MTDVLHLIIVYTCDIISVDFKTLSNRLTGCRDCTRQAAGALSIAQKICIFSNFTTNCRVSYRRGFAPDRPLTSNMTGLGISWHRQVGVIPLLQETAYSITWKESLQDVVPTGCLTVWMEAMCYSTEIVIIVGSCFYRYYLLSMQGI